MVTTPRPQVAVLYADVHGYSLHMGRDEAGTFRRLMAAVSLFRQLIGDYGGQLCDIAGDSILATFDEPTSALRFAATFQSDWSGDEVWQESAAPMRFRIGLHFGEVGRDGASVYGQTINIAARLQRLAAPGEICASHELRHAIGGAPASPWRPLGLVKLHNIDQTVVAYIVRAAASLPAAVEAQAHVRPPPAVGAEPSLALLPLRVASGDASDRFLADGTIGDIITALTRFREVAVIARHSAFQFRNAADPAHVARCLGVRYVATGALQHDAARLRLTVRLEEAESGEVLWAETFNGGLGDIFEFQAEATTRIASRIALTVRRAEMKRLQNAQAPVLGAYGLVLRGHELSLRFRRDTNLHARRLFETATELDPGYGRSYAALSRTHNYDWRYSWTERPEAALDTAVDLARDAVQRDETDARGYAELGYARLYRKEHDAAIAAYERALELNPNDADILAEYADALVYNGEPQRAVELVNRAMRLNPFYPDWYLWYLADAYDAAQEPEQVVATVHRMRNPDEGRRLLAANLAHLGRLSDAKREAEAVIKLHPGFTVQHWATRPPYRARAVMERFMEGMRRAGLPDC